MKLPLVSIIIPVYNKADKVARAIDSAFAQTYTEIEVIVVDDGSTDSSAEEAKAALERHGGGKYVYQDNAGVAIARNTGVFKHSHGELVVCLDADDAIGTRYLELLAPRIWEDREIGVVYTTLLNINQDGSKKVSPWPSKFDARAHFFERFNQVPTAALARREVWTRLGGQRQRYAPYGAGAEDGDFWLRAAAYGFLIQFYHPAFGESSMFHYSAMQGMVSGNRTYREVPFRKWSPWTVKPDIMPTASIAPATRFSHPARKYDQPAVSVIIPVGTGHTKYLVDCLDSLDAQTFQMWEAIVVFDIDKPEWKDLEESGDLDYIFNTWPFCRFTSTHAEGKFAREITDTLEVVLGRKSLLAGLPAGRARGAGVARNIGIEAANGPLLIFLDADDYFVPEALDKMVRTYNVERKIIFAEHYGVAPIEKDKLNDVLGEVVDYNDKTGLALIKQGVTDYDCKKASDQPYTDGRVPYIICNVSTLIPKKWAQELGGFPEDLSSWEDVLFWWMASWRGHCFAKIKEPLLVYRYHTGYRREIGRENALDLLRYIKNLRKEFDDMGCNCGEAPGAGVIIDSYGSQVEGVAMATLNLSRGSQLAVDDGDLVQVVFSPPDRGDKLRFGQHDFGGGNFIKYGRLAGGETIFVHQLDIDADLSISRAQSRAPLYKAVAAPVEYDLEPAPEPDAPEPVSDAIFEAAVLEAPADVEEAAIAFAEAAEVVSEADEDYFPPVVEGEYPSRLTPLADIDVGDLRNPGRYIALLEAEGIETAFQIVAWNREHEKGLSEITGIGPKAAKVFSEAADGLV
jgi:glycosyltransferase involved in cell wall biosynthesis